MPDEHGVCVCFIIISFLNGVTCFYISAVLLYAFDPICQLASTERTTKLQETMLNKHILHTALLHLCNLRCLCFPWQQIITGYGTPWNMGQDKSLTVWNSASKVTENYETHQYSAWAWLWEGVYVCFVLPHWFKVSSCSLVEIDSPLLLPSAMLPLA